MKRVVMTNSNGKVRIDPDFCTHENAVVVSTGHVYTFAGEYDDNIRAFRQCLTCGQVEWDDGTWHDRLEDTASDEVPF